MMLLSLRCLLQHHTRWGKCQCLQGALTCRLERSLPGPNRALLCALKMRHLPPQALAAQLVSTPLYVYMCVCVCLSLSLSHIYTA